MKLGAHESASGGPYTAIKRAEEDGCEAVQLFVKNNNRWRQRAWREDEVEAFRTRWADSSLQGLVAHAAYLINLCSADEETVAKSIEALADELTRCAQLGVPYLVMHPGSHMGIGEPQGLVTIAGNLRRVYDQEPSMGLGWQGVTLLFENTAGQGTNLGWQMSHLRDLMGLVHDPTRFGVCFDTCHAHAAGIELRTEPTYEAFWQSFDETVGLEHLRAFHLNDSKRALGSRVDRHERIGLGEIGLECFRLLANDPRFEGLPSLLETPALPDGSMSFAHGVSVVKGLRGKQTCEGIDPRHDLDE